MMISLGGVAACSLWYRSSCSTASQQRPGVSSRGIDYQLTARRTSEFRDKNGRDIGKSQSIWTQPRRTIDTRLCPNGSCPKFNPKNVRTALAPRLRHWLIANRAFGCSIPHTEQMPAKHTRCKCARRIDADQSPVIHRQSAISKLRQERRTALRPLAVPLQPRSMLLQLLRRRRHLVGIGTTSESFISMMRTQYTISGNVG
jgi:hypothetical protein